MSRSEFLRVLEKASDKEIWQVFYCIKDRTKVLDSDSREKEFLERLLRALECPPRAAVGYQGHCLRQAPMLRNGRKMIKSVKLEVYKDCLRHLEKYDKQETLDMDMLRSYLQERIFKLKRKLEKSRSGVLEGEKK